MEDLPTRFEVELEFVQSLANIQYVTYLATQQNNIFKDIKFKNYLKYLEYWSRPPYSQYTHATISLDDPNQLDNIDDLPKFLQLHGAELMNEMVNRWNT